MEVAMSLPEVVSREEWQMAREQLLAREKELTRRQDALNADRRRLPMVRIDKDYVFEGEAGEVSLPDLFDGCAQLVVYHAMFDPEWHEACMGCRALMEESSSPRLITRLKGRDTSFVRISLAPYAKIAAYREARGWTFPWYSSYGSDFNRDFEATVGPKEAPSEQSGFSCFLRNGPDVFHTYSTYARGTERIAETYALLDITAFGRQEDWEEPKGRAPKVHPGDPRFI
jgi:predicted dithiol-disulfide oxidoreductase (DUF899 family)